MGRSILVVVTLVGATLVVAPAVIVTALVSRDSPFIDSLIRAWARSIIRAAGIRLDTEHMEVLDPDRRYILVANHHSYFDIPCLLAAVSQPVRFMAKVSLFSIPIFGRALRSAGFIPIDRKNRSQNLRAFELAGERIRRGNTIVVFPEEGRTREWKMREFQRGAFLLGMKTGLPLVPVAICGTRDVLPATRLTVRPGPVTIRFAPPIETAEIPVSRKQELMDSTRATIETMLEEGCPPNS